VALKKRKKKLSMWLVTH
jgi:hypothetical protein